MSPAKRVLISLLITTVISIAFIIYASTSGFSLFEKNIYAPAKTNQIQAENSKMADFYLQKQKVILHEISDFAAQTSSLTFFKRTISPQEEEEREANLTHLEDALPFLYGIRLVEKDGVHVHFSTFYPDFIFEENQLRSYKNYTDVTDFSLISTESSSFFCKTIEDFTENAQIYFDSNGNRIIFSLPAFDEDTTFRGTWLFYIDTYALFDLAIYENLLSIGRNFSVVAKEERVQNQKGIVFNIPLGKQQNLVSEILRLWETSNGTVAPIYYTNNESYQKYILISTKEASDLRFSQICAAEEFTLSAEEKTLLLFTQFLVTFLIIILAFMTPASREASLAKKIRTLEHILFREYSESPQDFPEKFEKRLSKQKYGIFSTFRKTISPKNNKERLELNDKLEESWQRLTNALLKTLLVNQSLLSKTKENAAEIITPQESKESFNPQTEYNLKSESESKAEKQESNSSPTESLEELEELPPDDEDIEELEELLPDDD